MVYYETGTGSDRKKTDIMFQSSSDNGTTWSETIKVTTASTDETDGNADSNGYGEYNGLSAAHNTFFASWTDRRNAKAKAIFVAKVVLRAMPVVRLPVKSWLLKKTIVSDVAITICNTNALF